MAWVPLDHIAKSAQRGQAHLTRPTLAVVSLEARGCASSPHVERAAPPPFFFFRVNRVFRGSSRAQRSNAKEVSGLPGQACLTTLWLRPKAALWFRLLLLNEIRNDQRMCIGGCSDGLARDRIIKGAFCLAAKVCPVTGFVQNVVQQTYQQLASS